MRWRTPPIMKPHPVWFALLLSATPLPAQEPGTAPAYWFENVPAGDGSIQASLVFTTIPGVQYTVETTHNLTDWMEVASLYGMGHEFVTPMREFTAPPPPDPNAPPPAPWAPTSIVSLRLTPSSDAAGGTVVSWISLDDETVRITLLPDALDTGWASLPFFSECYDAYYFFVSHPLASIPPPLANPELGPLDAAMITILQTSLADMNQRVADATARSRNAPPPAPPDPLSTKFWRIKADWSLDSDADGIADFIEFANADAVPAVLDGPRGDTFDPDTDRNGIIDGLQLDFDGDGVVEMFDVNSGQGNSQDNNLVNWQRTPDFRFAAFQLPVALAPGESVLFCDLSPKGTVRLAKRSINGDWWPVIINRNLLSCPTPDCFYSACAPLLGDRVLGWLTSPLSLEETVWDPLTDTLEAHPFPIDDETWRGGDAPDPIFDAYGDFWVGWGCTADKIAFELTTPDGPLASTRTSYQDMPTDEVRIEESRNIVSGNGYWRYNPAGTAYGTKTDLPEVSAARSASFIRRAEPRSDPAESLHYWNLVAGSSCLLISDNSSPFAKSAVTYKPGQHPVGVTSQGWLATDQAVWNYDQWTPLTQLLGVAGTVDQATLRDVVDTGLAVADIKTRSYEKTCLLIPIIADGVDNDPSKHDDEDPAGGVDRLSMTAPFAGSGKTSQIWLMAPNSPPPPQSGPAPAPLVNAVRIRAPLNDKTTLHFGSDAKVKFPDDALTAHDQTIQIRGLATDTATTSPTLKLADRQEAANHPIGVVAMKKRVVKVAVHRVTGLNAAGTRTTPKFMQAEADMEAELNKVYGRQTNTTFDVTIYQEDGTDHNGIDYDSIGTNVVGEPPPHDGFVNATTATTTDANNKPISIIGPELTLATPNAKSVPIPARPAVPAHDDVPEMPEVVAVPATANIDVWVLGGVTLTLGSEPVYGAHFGKELAGTVVIDGDLKGATGNAADNTAGFCYVLAHEIGHVMLGNGHPDCGQGNAVLRWVPASQAAPRPTMDPRDQQRLMCSGPGMNPALPGKQLIYKEWSLIETWLKKEEDEHRLPP